MNQKKILFFIAILLGISYCQDGELVDQPESICQAGSFYNYQEQECQDCDPNCATCEDNSTKCTSCSALVDSSGWELDMLDWSCKCNHNSYLTATINTSDKPCERCYKYGSKCVIKCPSGTEPIDSTYTCEGSQTETSGDGTRFMMLLICLVVIIVQIILTLFLFQFLMKKLLQFYNNLLTKKYPMSKEEEDWINGQKEREKKEQLAEEEKRRIRLEQEEEERKRRLEEEEAERQRRIAQEEEERRIRLEKEEEERKERMRIEEEERQQRLEIEEKLRREEEERRRLEEEERQRRRQEEEEQRRKDEEEKERLRQEEEERQRREEEERERLRREEEERLRREEEEKERQRQEEERLKREAEEAEKQRKRELARQAREQRKMERQMTRQKTMAANEDKLKKMREEREKLQQQKSDMESHNQNLLNSADSIDGQFNDIQEKQKRAQLRRQETIKLKQGIFQRQATMVEKRKELEEALEGVNYQAAKEAVANINQEDIVFIQNLKNPPEKIKMTMEAVIMTLSNAPKKQKWDDIKKEMNNVNFRKNIQLYDPESMKTKVMNKLQKEYISNDNWNLPKIHKAAKAAGILAEWLDSLIKFKIMMEKNRPLFEQVRQLEIEEKGMAKDLEKVAELEDEEEKLQKEEEEAQAQEGGMRDKQEQLRKQATMNLGDLEKTMEQLNNLNTDQLSLEEIEEGDSEEESEEDD